MVSCKQERPSSGGSDVEQMAPPARRSSEKEGDTGLPSFCGDLTPREPQVRAPANCAISTITVLTGDITDLGGQGGGATSRACVVARLTRPRPSHAIHVAPAARAAVALRELDVEDEVELRVLQTDGAAMFEVRVRVDEKE